MNQGQVLVELSSLFWSHDTEADLLANPPNVSPAIELACVPTPLERDHRTESSVA